MTAYPTLPALSMSGAYLDEAFADEKALAVLLGWTLSTAPQEMTATSYLRGFKGSTFKASIGPERIPNPMAWLPMWRRGNDCFELIGRCNLCIMFSGDSVLAGQTGQLRTVEAMFADHPSKDNAIRYAVCKAAIAYLQAEKSKERGA